MVIQALVLRHLNFTSSANNVIEHLIIDLLTHVHILPVSSHFVRLLIYTIHIYLWLPDFAVFRPSSCMISVENAFFIDVAAQEHFNNLENTFPTIFFLHF